QPLSYDTCSNKSPALLPDNLTHVAKKTFSNLISKVCCTQPIFRILNSNVYGCHPSCWLFFQP
ncbi:MAG: hypothetical protein MUO88_04305, partial [Desulfobacterales bacterium]|nr:hypothetical protein [Desulfobacterales bacterium]